MTMLRERWVDGREKFELPGEQLLMALVQGVVIGVGGLSQCPTVVGVGPGEEQITHRLSRRA